MGKFNKIFLCLKKYLCFTSKSNFDQNNYTIDRYDSTFNLDFNTPTPMARVPYSNMKVPSTRRRRQPIYNTDVYNRSDVDVYDTSVYNRFDVDL